jgi:hypothetical protein
MEMESDPPPVGDELAKRLVPEPWSLSYPKSLKSYAPVAGKNDDQPEMVSSHERRMLADEVRDK